MRFAVMGAQFSFDGRYLSEWRDDGQLRSCADLSLFTYGWPTAADAVHAAIVTRTDPRFS